jgi:diadenosine tetraphosphate (Ap4A) HIT family hydrolase
MTVLIRDFLGHEWTVDCIGCAISGGLMAVPGGFIQRTQNFCVHQDPLIPLPGFLVIASLLHIRSLSELNEAQYREFSQLLWITHRAIKAMVGVEHVTIVQEESSQHFHLWFFPWTQQVIERYGQPSLSKIRDIMSDYRKHPIDKDEWCELEKSIDRMKPFLNDPI